MEIQEESAASENDSSKNRSDRWASFRGIGDLLRSQWPKYMMDIVVIILGISISFTLDGRKEEATRAASEQVYLQSLLGDITSDIDELNKVINKTKTVVDKGYAILELTKDPGKENIDLTQFSNDFKDIVARPNFVSKDATFSDLRSSGNMQLLTNTKLKAELFTYFRLYESNKAVEISERETMNTIIAPYLMKRFSIAGLTANDKTSILKNGVDLQVVLSENEFSNAVALRLSAERN